MQNTTDQRPSRALYPAAGHPPLLRWREGKLDRIESNGLVFGVVPDPDLLYTDGVTEPQNARGDFFGDSKFEQVVRKDQLHPPSELVDQLLSEIRLWQPTSRAQQDDITLIVIDVV